MRSVVASVLVLLIFISTFSMLASKIAAAAPSTEWTETYGGSNNDSAYHVVQTSDGGYAIAGDTESYGGGNDDFWLVKTNFYGNEQWSQTYGETNDFEKGRSVVQTSDGGFLLAGYILQYSGPLNEEFLVVKTDSSGNEQWSKTYGGSGNDRAFDAIQTSDGGYAIVGYTYSYGSGQTDFWLVKTNSAGTKQWDRTYGGVNQERAVRIVQTSDGGYALAGCTNSYGSGSYDFWLVKTDSSGNKQWDKTYGGSDYDWAYSLHQTSDGGYAIAGDTDSYGSGMTDFWLVKANSAGNMQWSQTYGGSATSSDTVWAIDYTADGGYIIVGDTDRSGNWDFWVVKTTSTGSVQWSQTYGGTSDDHAASVQQTADLGYIIAGITESYGAGQEDFWLIKLEGGNLDGEISSWNVLTPELEAGDQLRVQVTVDNIGEIRAEYNVYIGNIWDSEEHNVGNGYSESHQIIQLDSGASQTLTLVWTTPPTMEPGVYTGDLVLQIARPGGGWEETKQYPHAFSFTVVVPTEIPVAVLSASPTDVEVGETVTFDGSDSYDPDGGSIVSYFYDFDDGFDSGWTSQSIYPYEYDAPGDYYAKLKVEDDEGEVSSWSSTIHIHVSEPIMCRLTVYSAHDNPVPDNGDHFYDDGEYVTCEVTSPVVEGDTIWTCTGWSGSGSVPLSDGGTSVGFTITQDSSITWNWEGEQIQIHFPLIMNNQEILPFEDLMNAILLGEIVDDTIEVDVTPSDMIESVVIKVSGTSPDTFSTTKTAEDTFALNLRINNPQVIVDLIFSFTGAHLAGGAFATIIGPQLSWQVPRITEIIATDIYGYDHSRSFDIPLASAGNPLQTYFTQSQSSNIIALCPVDILITDSEGQRVGAVYENGEFVEIICEIPGAYYARNDVVNGEKYIYLPFSDDFYDICVFGNQTGEFNLTAYTIMDQDFNGSFSIVENQIEELEQVRYYFAISHEDEVTLELPVINIDTGLSYTTIQEAIEAPDTMDGHTIYIHQGTYYENVVITKTLMLVSEDNNAIVNGNGTGSCIRVFADNVRIENFTILSSGTAFPNAGIEIYGENVSIIRNEISGCGCYSIFAYNSSGILIQENVIIDTASAGIYLLDMKAGTTILNNRITNSNRGIVFDGSNYNIVIENTIENNSDVGIWGGANNTIYHNNFLYNSDHIKQLAPNNIWDHGYPSGGNYWSDYIGLDLFYGLYQNRTGFDGIGDVPYIIDGDNQDAYPLAEPWPCWRMSFMGPTMHPIVDFAVCSGKLYAAAGERLYEFDGINWNVIPAPTFIISLEAWQDTLIIGGANGLYLYNGTDFSLIISVPTYIKTLGIFNNVFYAGTILDNPPALYYCNGSANNPADWHVDTYFTAVLNFSGPFGSIDAFAVYNNIMHITSGGTTYCYNGTEWSILKAFNDVYAFLDMQVCNGKLYFSTRDQAWRKPIYQGYSGFSGRVIEYDGNNWTTVMDHDYWIYSLEAYNGKLYAGTANKILSYNGTEWQASFHTEEGAYYTISLIVYDDMIYAGMGNGYLPFI